MLSGGIGSARHRCPGANPVSWLMSRKISLTNSGHRSINHCLRAIAGASSLLEWLKKIRGTPSAPSAGRAWTFVQPQHLIWLIRFAGRAARPSCAAHGRGDRGPAGLRDGIPAGQVQDPRSNRCSRSPRTSPRPARTIG